MCLRDYYERRKMNNHNAVYLDQYAHLFKELSKGEPIWFIAVYARLSKEDKKTVSASIEFQIKIIAKFIERSGLDNFRIVDIYIDDGRTGTDFDREDYIRLQDDITDKTVNCLIVKDLSRYSRNVMEGIAELDRLVLKQNLRFINADRTLQIDTFKDPKAISSPKTYQALQDAETHAYNTSIKIRETQSIKRDYGEPTGGFPPYGFLKNPAFPYELNYVIDPVAIKIVQQIFKWSSKEHGAEAIAKKLNKRKIPNPTEYKRSVLELTYSNPNVETNKGLWYATTVSRILKNKVYIGYMVQGKTERFDHKRHKAIPVPEENQVIVEDCHEKAIDTEEFKNVQKQRIERTRSTKTGTPHLFANVARCSGCGGALKKTNSGKNHYLVCRTKRELGEQFCEQSCSISLSLLENTVLPVVQSQISLVENYQELVDKINQNTKAINQSKRIEQLLKETKGKIQEMTNKLDQLYEDARTGIISKERFARTEKRDEEKIKQLQEYQSQLKLLQRKAKEGITSENSYFQTFLNYKNITSLDRAMVLELIDKIYIKPDKSLDIVFKYKDQFELINDFIRENQGNTRVRKK